MLTCGVSVCCVWSAPSIVWCGVVSGVVCMCCVVFCVWVCSVVWSGVMCDCFYFVFLTNSKKRYNTIQWCGLVWCGVVCVVLCDVMCGVSVVGFL